MDKEIFFALLQDGVTVGTIYALLAVAFILVFSVTRILFVAQGDFVAYGALTLAAFESGRTPGSVWLLLGMGFFAGVLSVLEKRGQLTGARLRRIALVEFLLPVVIVALALAVVRFEMGMLARTLVTLAVVVPMGPYMYRICFQRISNASILTLLITSVGVHWMMIGFGLFFFGAEGYRTLPLVEGSFWIGSLYVSGQTVLMLFAAALFLVVLHYFFTRTLAGKALQAAAVNPRGARMVGISPEKSGQRAFAMAALIGATAGLLIGPITTIYYDSGFLIGLKGFIAAIVGGFVSYPLALVSAAFIGLSEAFSAFWASTFKEAIVFALIVPVLLWRSIYRAHVEED